MQRVFNHDDSRQVAQILNQVVSQFENTGTVSLANSATTTTVSNAKITSQSKIFLQPRNANAASSGAFVSAISTGSFTITHNNGTTARAFDYVVFGV